MVLTLILILFTHFLQVLIFPQVFFPMPQTCPFLSLHTSISLLIMCLYHLNLSLHSTFLFFQVFTFPLVSFPMHQLVLFLIYTSLSLSPHNARPSPQSMLPRYIHILAGLDFHWFLFQYLKLIFVYTPLSLLIMCLYCLNLCLFSTFIISSMPLVLLSIQYKSGSVLSNSS